MKVKSKKVVYECPIFKVEEREVVNNGSDQTFWVIIRPPNVVVIGLTKDKKIVLIKEILKGKECICLPGGKVEKYDYSDDDVKKQALAELKEEAGYVANKIELLSKKKSHWSTTEREFYGYVAWDLNDIGQNLEDGEAITRYLVSVEEAEEIIRKREMAFSEEERILEKAILFLKKKN